MICPILSYASAAQAAALCEHLLTRDTPQDAGQLHSTEAQVSKVLEAVRSRGLPAVIEYTRQFDCPDFSEQLFAVPQEDLEAAAHGLPTHDQNILRQAIANIQAFHAIQKEQSWHHTQPDGTMLGQRVRPVERAGIYVPGGQGGTTPLLSSLLMGAIPASIAGVPEIVVVSPPQADGTIHPALLGTAHLLGIKQVYAAGSAWAIAALAYGAGPLRPVDVIAGPGNIYVATAKRLLIGKVGIDMIAGPSEVCIIADSTANPAWIAADMLAQAEHDTLASAVCLTTSIALANKLVQELETQCALLPRDVIARQSLLNYGAVIVVPSLNVATDIANLLAPEHLEIFTENPEAVFQNIHHAGAVFLGEHSAEALGDYFAGPNHVLPTMGTARFASALGVGTFYRKTSVIMASKAFAGQSAPGVAHLARMEGLEGHARSALCRASTPST